MGNGTRDYCAGSSYAETLIHSFHLLLQFCLRQNRFQQISLICLSQLVTNTDIKVCREFTVTSQIPLSSRCILCTADTSSNVKEESQKVLA